MNLQQGNGLLIPYSRHSVRTARDEYSDTNPTTPTATYIYDHTIASGFGANGIGRLVEATTSDNLTRTVFGNLGTDGNLGNLGTKPGETWVGKPGWGNLGQTGRFLLLGGKLPFRILLQAPHLAGSYFQLGPEKFERMPRLEHF